MRALLLAIAIMMPTLMEAQERNAKPCTGGSIDSAWVAASPVYRDCEVDRPARERSLPKPSFVAPLGVECATVDVEFVIDTVGRVETTTARVVETNAPEYATRVVASLERARYAPAQREGRPVRQLVRARVARDSGRVPFVVRSPNGSAAPPPPPARTECR